LRRRQIVFCGSGGTATVCDVEGLWDGVAAGCVNWAEVSGLAGAGFLVLDEDGALALACTRLRQDDFDVELFKSSMDQIAAGTDKVHAAIKSSLVP